MSSGGSVHGPEKPVGPPSAGAGIWYDKPLDAVLTAFGTSGTQGLSAAAAAIRLRETGANILQKGETISRWRIFANQFGSLVIWVLIGAGMVSAALGEYTDGIAIVAIVVLNAALGFFQEYRAEQAAAALARLTAPRARVMRDGHAREIDATEVVPGDILLLEAGDLVAADARLIEASALRANEASLTGESVPVEKRAGTCPPQAPLADRTNMIFLVSSITGGSGRAVVTATGMQTEVGHISALLETATRGKTPLQKRIDIVGRKLLYLSFGVVGVVFLLGLLRSMPVFDLFLAAVSLAVAAIPEGLPAVITIALALGMQRMAKRNALVRRLAAVETLGCAQVICTDKTGTLTVGEMTARRLVTAESDFTVTGEGYETAGTFLSDGSELSPTGDPALMGLLSAGVACNDAEIASTGNRPSIVGDPTEGALLVAAAKANVSRAGIEEAMPKLNAIPFDSDRKRMTVIRRRENQLWAFVKGAPEVILERCTTIHTARGPEPLTREISDRFAAVQAEMARGALRVLAVAERPLAGLKEPVDEELDHVEIERDLTFLGLVGLQDPPRAEARDAVARCKRAGVRTVMITGDHRETGRAIAQELGILLESDGQSQVMAGSDLDSISDDELRGRVAAVAVYARVTAEHKLRIVRAWKARGAVVAMTGDGVNDAPALKESSIGIAMGITGTEVTKQAADIIITDDNFASIVSAVEEGRGIYDNVAKTLGYLLAGNCGELFLMLFAAIVGWPLPLLPIQLLWINLVTDGLPALALATDPVDQDILARAPRLPDAELMDKAFISRTVVTGMLTATVALIAFAYEFFVDRNIAQARNAAFSTLVIAELLRSFGARSDTRTVFETGLLSNMRLFAVVLASFAMQLTIHHTPVLETVFGTQPITWLQCLAWTGLGALPLTVMEIRKVFLRRRADADQPKGRWTMKPGTRWAIGIAVVTLAAIGAALIPSSPVRRWWDARQAGQIRSTAEPSAAAGKDAVDHSNMPGMSGGDAMPEMPNTVVINQERLQSVGVRFEQAERRTLDRLIRTVGRAEIDERLLAHVNIKLEGWIEELSVNYTGEKVERGQLLFTLYSPELLATQQEYLLAIKAANILKNNPSARAIDNSVSLVASAKQRLRLWDITEEQIRELERTGVASKTVAFYSPISGTVIKKTAIAGMKVNPGEEMYAIADLSQIWIVGDIYEYELPFIRLGQAAVVSLSYDPGRTVSGRVAFIYPTLEPETRTAKVRLEVPNPGERIKPGMYANIELRVPLGRRLAVPRDAVLETGERQIIFINHGEGKLEWRNAKLGVQAGDWVEILEGLKEGEQIVTSANFLIDSESRLKSAVGGMAGMTH